MRAVALGFVCAVVLGAAACDEESGDSTGTGDVTSTGAISRPTRFARALDVETCEHSDLAGRPIGRGSQVGGGLDCADVPDLYQAFTTGFTDANLKKEFVDRGGGWSCWQQLSASGFRVELFCWNDDGRFIRLDK